MKMHTNRKYCINPSKDEKRLLMSSRNNGRHLAVTFLSKKKNLTLPGGNKMLGPFFSELAMHVVGLLCPIKTH